MKNQNVLKLSLCLIVSCCMVWIQCSMIGYHIGGSMGAEKEMVSIPGWKVQEVMPGADLEIVLLNGKIIQMCHRLISNKSISSKLDPKRIVIWYTTQQQNSAGS